MAMTKKWTVNSAMDKKQASQVIFHCWFGTYKEDFGILSCMTNINNWYTRKQIDQRFKALSLQSPVEVDLIKLNYASKMSTCNQTGFFSETKENPTGSQFP